MLFQPKREEDRDGRFAFSGKVTAVASPCFNKDVIKEFWNNFSFGFSSLEISESEELTFRIGGAEPLALDGYAYTINVTPCGICLNAENEKALLCAFMTLLDRIYAIDTENGTAAAVDCAAIWDRACIDNRMVHFCVFPETELYEIERFVRFVAALRYTHLIIEFWGMLRFECLRELSWPFAFDKEDIRPIMQRARDLGLEIIPMFNHWGHASAGRVMHGKHVVLDQNISLQSYFSRDGWCWDIRKPKVRELLRKIRAELTELCGEGEYFHIGCDEAYDFDLEKEESQRAICEFINETASELKKSGRRTIVWGDMFLYKHPHYNPLNKYDCNAPTVECEKNMLALLDRDVIVADWQYNAKKAPVETASVFANAGFDCIMCPWDRGMEQMKACVSTVKEQKLFGLMHTTWHTLSSGTPYTAIAALGCFGEIGIKPIPKYKTETAALLRRVYLVRGEYARSGWAKKEIGIIT